MSPRSAEKKVVRQEVRWVPESRIVEYAGAKRPFRVWSLYSTDPTVTPELPITPAHHHNAFLEDHVHDWIECVVEGKTCIRYFSRVAQSGLWILLEFTE